MIPRSRSLPKSTFINLIPGNCLVLSFFPRLIPCFSEYLSSSVLFKEIRCLLRLNSDLSAIKLSNEQWFFFCKLKIASHFNRATKSGYWKAIGRERYITSRKLGPSKSSLIGIKKTLVYHTGRVPKGERTSWVVYEYSTIATHQVCFSRNKDFSLEAKR